MTCDLRSRRRTLCLAATALRAAVPVEGVA